MEQIDSRLLLDRIPFIRGGAGTKRAVVFFGGNALLKRLDKTSDPGRYARQVAKLLPPDFSFWILGYEERAHEPLTFESILAGMAEVVGAEIGRADLVVGISFGGFVAQRLGAQYPELAARLVLLASAHRLSAAGWQVMERQFRSLESGDMYRFALENALLFRRPWYNWLLRLKLRLEKERLSSGYRDPALILRDYKSLFSEDLRRSAEFARRIEQDTLVIAGTSDQYFDRDALSETASMIKHARLELFEGETHMFPIERSGDVASRLAAFLDGR